MDARRRACLSVLLVAGLVACVATPAPHLEKVRFDLGGIRSDGLAGPADGLVSIDYEYLIPADPEKIAEVKRLDPSARVSLVARGRIGRKDGQALCSGNTHQKEWRQVLERLTALDYVTEIRRCFWE